MKMTVRLVSKEELAERASSWLSGRSSDDSYIDASSEHTKRTLADLLVQVQTETLAYYEKLAAEVSAGFVEKTNFETRLSEEIKGTETLSEHWTDAIVKRWNLTQNESVGDIVSALCHARLMGEIAAKTVGE